MELEARALVKSLRRVALSVFGSDIRQLLLADNMAVVLSFDRFKSRNYRLLKQIRVFTSYLLARNISATVRWIPSELNNSGEPSRLFAQEGSKLTLSRPLNGRALMGPKREPILRPPLERSRKPVRKEHRNRRQSRRKRRPIYRGPM